VHDADAGSYVLYVDGVAQAKTWTQPARDAAPAPWPSAGRSPVATTAIHGLAASTTSWCGTDRVLTAADIT
jgi:hypothetical protein